MKQQVFFKVKNLRISKMTDIYATEGNRNVFEAVFDFETKDWDGLAKTAVFENTQGVKEKQLLNEDKCDIPNIFFATSGVGYVSVFAGDFMVTNKIPIIIVNAGYNISDPNPEAANYFEQILKYFDATNLNAKKYGDMARRYAVGDGAFPESLKDNAEYYCGKTSEDAKKTGEDRKEVERLVESVNSIAKQVKSITDEGIKQTSVVTIEGEKQVQAVQAVSEGIAQETTAREILEKCSNTIPYLKEIAQNSSKAGSLNGFVLEKGISDSVVLSYTDPETGEFGGAAVLPRETTLKRIDESLKGMVASLKIIALQKGAEV